MFRRTEDYQQGRRTIVFKQYTNILMVVAGMVVVTVVAEVVVVVGFGRCRGGSTSSSTSSIILNNYCHNRSRNILHELSFCFIWIWNTKYTY